jgi:hypothetical protein
LLDVAAGTARPVGQIPVRLDEQIALNGVTSLYYAAIPIMSRDILSHEFFK